MFLFVQGTEGEQVHTVSYFNYISTLSVLSLTRERKVFVVVLVSLEKRG